MHLSQKMSCIDSSPIRKAFELAQKIENPINLSIGQPHFPCPNNIVKAIQKALEEKKTAYTLTAGIPELKEALAKKYQTLNQISYAKPENILVTSGISSALFLLFNAILDPGDKALLVTPYFLMYKSMVEFYGGQILTISENFEPSDLKKLENHKIKIILFSTPSNPTGKILSKEQLLALANFADAVGSWLVSDEIYELFDYDKKFLSVGKYYDKTITLSGFSKSYSMTGLRLASILAPSNLIQALTTLQQYTVVCAPSAVQWGGIEALQTDMSNYIDDYRKKRDFLYNSLKDYYEFQKPDGAFYCFLKVPVPDEQFIQDAVEKEKIILVPGYIFCNSHNYVRISFATTWENLEKGMEGLQRMAKSYGK